MDSWLGTYFLISLFDTANVRYHMKYSRTYPGLFPFLHLDHIFFDPVLRLEMRN